MAYQALYRKYRPQTFLQVVGQEHITDTLRNELASGKLVHAYLFTGTRGTGKTSCAKILAKAINCLSPENGDPCGKCEICRSADDGELTDIVEIDAASNNGVDDIRELREQVAFAPATAKYRVYIIDEVHMLSINAFNALLKTLEEPPAHVVFILATTEVHKLPATILSRCQRFDFRRIESSKICERIQYVAGLEGLSVTDDAATLIAAAADGGMRDALSILDLCASSGAEIDEDAVAGVCSMAGNDYLVRLADLIKSRDTEGALLLLDELHNSSVDMLRLLTELTRHYRDLMIVKTVKSGNKPVVCSAARMRELERQAAAYDIREIMSSLSVLQGASAGMQTGNRRCEMEMTVIGLCNPSLRTDLTSLEARITALELSGGGMNTAPVMPVKAVPEVREPVTETADDSYDDAPPPEPPEPPDVYTEPPVPADSPENQPASDGETRRVEKWDKVLGLLQTSCPLIAGVLQDSSAYTRGGYLLIDTKNSQFRSLVNGDSPIFRDSIRRAAKQVLGDSYRLGPYRAESQEATDPLARFAERLEKLEKK